VFLVLLFDFLAVYDIPAFILWILPLIGVGIYFYYFLKQRPLILYSNKILLLAFLLLQVPLVQYHSQGLKDTVLLTYHRNPVYLIPECLFIIMGLIYLQRIFWRSKTVKKAE